MTNISFNCIFGGQRESDGWKHFTWLVSINGISFEYHTGLAHFTSYFKNNYNEGITSRNAKPDNSLAVPALNGWVHIPQLNQVLESLFLDADCSTDNFDEFCANCGYDNDSLKALDIYRACMYNAKQLQKALGKEYNEVKEKIQDANQ